MPNFPSYSVLSLSSKAFEVGTSGKKLPMPHTFHASIIVYLSPCKAKIDLITITNANLVPWTSQFYRYYHTATKSKCQKTLVSYFPLSSFCM